MVDNQHFKKIMNYFSKVIVAFPFPPAAFHSLSPILLHLLSVANLCNFSHFHLWKHLIALICVSSMANGPEHLFQGLFVTPMSLLNYPFVSFVKKIVLILSFQPVIRHFSLSMVCLLIFFTASFKGQMLLYFLKSS